MYFVIYNLSEAARFGSPHPFLVRGSSYPFPNFGAGRRVSPPDPRPEGRESRLFFDFLGRELTFFGISLEGEGREWEKETPCGKGLGSWDT